MIVMSKNPVITSKTNLTKCCKYSWMSYFNPSIKKYDFVSSKRSISFLKGDTVSSQAIYIKENNVSYFAFRGSSDLMNMKDALTIIPTKTDIGYIHSGFYNQYLSLKDQVHEILKTDDSHEIYFVGHSMGGCVALITATFMKEAVHDKKVNCYTYGSPCTGDKVFIDKANSSIDDLLSIELKTDIVPYLPLIPFFKKPDNTLILNKDMSLSTVNILGEHSCREYYEKISKAIKKMNILS